MDDDSSAIGASSGDARTQSDVIIVTNAQSDSSPSGQHAPVVSTAVAAEAAAPAAISDANVRESAEITVNVKFIHHESVSLRCAPTISVVELRNQVMEVEHARASTSGGNDGDGGDPPRLRLIYKGKVLKDDQTLDAYNFQHEDTIHAVFGRPTTASSSASTATPPPAQEQTNASDAQPGSVHGEVRDMGNGFVMGRFNIDADTDSAVPDLGSLIGSVISGAMFGGAAPTSSSAPGVSAQVSFASASVPASTASISAPFTGTRSATTTSASHPATSFSATTSAPYTATPTSSTSSAMPTTTTGGVSPARAHFLAQTAATTQSRTNSAATFQDQAGALRRMMPPIDLGPMSRPPALSEEMYDLGNAVREASDTFMALHRQLAYLSGRLLNENNLSSLERARLRMRMQQLGPVLLGASDLATSLAQLLAGSRLGWPTRSTPAMATNENGPAPPPASGAGTGPTQPGPNGDASGGPASRGFSVFDYLHRGRGDSQPGGGEPVDRDPLSAASAAFASMYDYLQRSRDESQAAPDEAHNRAARPLDPSTAGQSVLNFLQRSSGGGQPSVADPADRSSPASQSNETIPVASDYIQRLRESTQSSASGLGLDSILAGVDRFLSHDQALERSGEATATMQPSPSGNPSSGVAPRTTYPPTGAAVRTTLPSRGRTASSSLPIISTTPISDLIAATLGRCSGSMETDISEFYQLSSDYMRRMFPASQPEHETRERRKEWRVRAMNEIETKAAFCCDEELVCRDNLLSPTMDAALDAFIRECLDASFFSSGVPADSPESPIHNAWIKIWSNVRSWVNRQPSSTGRLILSRILVEEVRAAQDRYDLQHLVRNFYDRTMECAAFATESDASIVGD